MNFDLRQELQRFGAASNNVKLFDAVNASLLRYVDLFPESAARKMLGRAPMPAGVVESDDRPLMYLYRADSLAVSPDDSADIIPELIRELACRSEGDYLAIVHPGELVIYPIALVPVAPKPERFRADDARAALLIPELAAGVASVSLRQQAANAKSLHRLLFDLITSVATALRESGALSIARNRDEVLPLVGRAIFTRFLVDRGIINPQTFPKLYSAAAAPELAFSTPDLAARTCDWLDVTFNGELLPLLFGVKHPKYSDYLAFFTREGMVGSKVLHEITNVMYRAPNGRLSLALSWEGIDFAHVPIGLLSEVYEDYAQRFYTNDAQRESVRYTPRHLAEFTVAHAFEGMPAAERAVARVLDPAAGAGIFLVLTLQRLVAETWRTSGKRPDTRKIRQILNEQVRGYDINHSALTLAALSLYLTALELDPDPFPPQKLKFDPLLGTVLHNMRDANEHYPQEQLVLGSLGSRGDLAPNDPGYDIVIGNPPWTSFATWGDKQHDFNDYVEDMVRRVLANKRPGHAAIEKTAAAYEHNDLLPDTAFLWRAIEWAKEGGIIALIVAGRLLFKRGDTGARVRDALFQSMQVTGVLNGTLLLPTWPNLNQAFCILFARNRAPEPHSRFTLVTPVLDPGPGGQPRMRIDHEARQPIDLQAALERPHLFKVLARGGRLDLDIVERIQNMALPEPGSDSQEQMPSVDSAPRILSIREYWREWNQGEKRYGQGYIPPGKKTNEETPKTRGRVAELLRRGALSLTSDDLTDGHGDLRIGLRVNPRQLEHFRTQKLYRLANPDIFNPPLVLINERFGKSPQEIRARLYLGKQPLVFRRNFYGFTCAGHPKERQLAKYLFCLINSDLFGYYTLEASAKFGVERRTLLVEDIEDFPIVSNLTDKQFDAIEKVADALDVNDSSTWRAMNRCIDKLYGLTHADERVMQDTLATMMPYPEVERRACAPAQRQELERFRNTVETLLTPFFEPDGERISVSIHDVPVEGWVAFDIRSSTAAASARDDTVTRIASQLANDEGASRLFQRVGPGFLRVAIRNHYRYITPSRARLCALDALREHGDVFPVRVNE